MSRPLLAYLLAWVMVVLVIAGIVVHGGRREAEFEAACAAKGGETARSGRFRHVCLKPGSIINVE